MEFLDEDARPRFLFQSRPLSSSSSSPSETNPQNTHQSPLSNPLLFISVSAFSSLLFLVSLLYLQSEPFKSLLIWVALSVFVGQFAPSQITGGDIRVGHGTILEPLEEEPEPVPEKPAPKRRSKAVRSEETLRNLVPVAEMRNGSASFGKKIGSLVRNDEEGEEERVWSEEDVEVLKRQMVKNPVGKPRRWEVIAEAFNGRHKVESVIKKGKELGEKKVDDGDSYAKFLKNRKPLDTRIHGETVGVESGGESGKGINGGGGGEGGGEGGEGGWSAGEDIALLNALKAFPKDVPMRWEKIAAAVPGKSKAACVKRVAELKRDFRSSKATAAADS